MTMTTNHSNPYFGPPPPITELKTEQEFKLRQLEIALNKKETPKEDIITVFLALQKQSFVLGNCLQNLLDKWPKPPTIMDLSTTDEVKSKSGILYVIKNSTYTSEMS